jgi:phage-related protein
MSKEARRETGYQLRMVQEGLSLKMPKSRPMPRIGGGCHELRVDDKNQTWRTIYYIGKEDIVVLHVVSKKTNKTPKDVIDLCKERLKAYKAATK